MRTPKALPAPAAFVCLLPLLAAFTACTGDGAASRMDAIARAEDHRPLSSEMLLEAAKDSSPAVRERAALAMGRIQLATYAEPLAALTAPGQAREVRRMALWSLGQLGYLEGALPVKIAVDAVAAALPDPDPAIAAAAVEALGKLAPAGAAETLHPYLAHHEPAVRREAAHALFRTRFAPVWRKQEQGPPELPDQAVAALAEALSDEAAQVRQAAAHAFSRYGQPAAVEALRTALGDAEEWVRLFAARALMRSRDDSAVPDLLELLGDESPRVRTEAVLAVAALRAADRLPGALAEDGSIAVRAALAQVLGFAEGPTSLEVLETLQQDEAPSVRAAAIESLARRLGEDFGAAVEGLLADPDWTIRQAAVRAVRFVRPSRGSRLINGVLKNDDARVRAVAVEVLGDLDWVGGSIAAQLDADDLAVRGTAVNELGEKSHPSKVEWLTPAYENSPGVDWVEVREGIVDALGNDESEEAVAFLKRIAEEDDSSSVRSRAKAALRSRDIQVPAEPPQAIEPSPYLGQTFEEAPVVVVQTPKGTFEIETLPAEAPIHVANFVNLVKQGFYDGLFWHRVVPNFVIQGGDPHGTGWGGPGYALRDEIYPRPYGRGSVGMPKAGKDTGGCQIFISHVPTSHLDGNYTIFGQVTSGMEVVDTIEVGDQILRAFVKE